MSKETYSIGDRVAGLYMSTRGSVLDYSGVVVAIIKPSSPSAHQKLTIRYQGGFERTQTAHPDYVFSMTPTIRLARRFHEVSPSQDPTSEAVATVLANLGLVFSPLDVGRVMWVIKFDHEALQGATSA
jgi:hypothetical protein